MKLWKFSGIFLAATGIQSQKQGHEMPRPCNFLQSSSLGQIITPKTIPNPHPPF